MSQDLQGTLLISPRALVHQEGALGLIAILILIFRDQGPVTYLAPRHGWTLALASGLVVGLVVAGLLWLLRGLQPTRDLELWFSSLLRQWSVTDAIAVAVISGIAEEVMVRALLQPIVGLVPASVIFALLHIFPDRRLWFWPIMAFVLGLVLGLLYNQLGYPAAALAHISINAVGLVRLCQLESRPSSCGPTEG